MTGRIGIIGGSGVYDFDGLGDVVEERVSTPFGDPSDSITLGTLEGVELAFLTRHGRGHRLSPSQVNYRANIWALKSLGVRRVLSVSAVGSLREEIVPGDFVLIDQFIDRTRHREDTFFADGIAAHVPFGDPVCEDLRSTVIGAAQGGEVRIHDGGTYLCMEGPQFSTRAESELYRSWGADVVGMTNITEARLAREACLCFSTIAMCTDFDCWHPEHEHVTVEQVIATVRANAVHARSLLQSVLPSVSMEPRCDCVQAMDFAVMTAPDSVSAEARERVQLLLPDGWGS